VTDYSALHDLAGRASDGDQLALETLLAELRPEIVRTARLIVGSGTATAEDAAQEALLDVANGIGSLREPAAVRAWALRVATTRALRVAKRERSFARRHLVRAVDLGVSDDQDFRMAALKCAFDALAPGARAVAVVRLFAGLSEREASEVLGCSVGTVKSQLHAARAQLAADLRRQGHTPAVSTSKERT
jgi:RNA polymerase sigma-70 factor, ECF subfamily